MSITKVTVRNFVEAVEHKALRSIDEKYNEQVNAEKERILIQSGVQDKLNQMQKKLSEIDKIHEEVISICGENKEMRYEHDRGYASIDIKLNVSFLPLFKGCTKFESNQLVELEKEHLDTKDAVTKEYAKVLASINRMSSVNKMIKYLKDIGFDTTSIEKEQTAITTNVDTKYLFVCGDNK